jgi:hypothetical protein
MAQDPKAKLRRSLIGPAGEYFVLYRLNSLGLLASLSPQNSPTIDILVLNPDEAVIATLQVKTRTKGSDRGWHMNKKHEDVVQPRLFYAFVDLEDSLDENDPEHPKTYVVPSSVVAKVLSLSHQAWLDTPGRGGRSHRDHPMRRLLPSYPSGAPGYPSGWLEQYRERWDLLTAIGQ